MSKKSDSNSDEGRIKYDEFKDLLSKAQDIVQDDTGSSVKARADKRAAEDRELIRNTDRALDNKALNEGITDISGFGASDAKQFDDGNESTMSEEEKREYYAKKSQESARKVDVALDNQALNRGETDIAGQGAGSDSAKKILEEKKAAGRKALLEFLNDHSSKPEGPQTSSEQPDQGQFL